MAGASRGIGLAIAQAVARAGAHTILAARSREALDREVAALRADGLSAEAILLDITSSDSIRAAVEAAGDIDILHNVAGTNVRKAFPAFTPEEYSRVMQTNLHGIVELTQLAGQKMIARGAGGKVVTIGSLMSVRGLPFLSVYAMTKSAVAGLTRVLAAEWARYNIQVNCIAPGFVITDLNRDVWKQQKMLDWLKGVQPNPVPGKPEDIAPLAVLLSSPGSDYITGQTIAVDGGYTTGAVWPFEG
ncbi:MAG: SDR family oxidoreductase [Bryobacteraceae bacterium]|nr:SDR family oxidoreductase [Bryobacteraceae bacterium]